MTQAVEATHARTPRMSENGRAAQVSGAGFDAMLLLLGEPAGGVGPGPESIGDAASDAAKDPGSADLDDIAAEEMRSASERPEHLKPRQGARPVHEPAPGRGPPDSPGNGRAAPAVATSADAPKRASAPSVPANPASDAHRAQPNRLATLTNPQVTQSPGAVAAAATRAAPTLTAAPASTGGARSVGALNTASTTGKDLLAKLETRQKPPILRASKEEIPAQVSRALASIVSEGGGRMTLRLNPEAMGEVRIDVEMRRGVASVRLNAQTDAARDLLDTDLGTLRAALERRGVSVERLEVVGPSDEAASRTDAETERNEDHPRDAGGAEKHGRSAGGKQGSAETESPEGPGAERGAESWEGPPVRTDADGVVRVDTIA